MKPLTAIKKLAYKQNILAMIYNWTCSHIKAFFSLDNFKSSTFSKEALNKLIKLEGIQIFESNKTYKTHARTCEKDIYKGNWSMFINTCKTPECITCKNEKYIVVCGFFNCKHKHDQEFMIKHMNLCKFAHIKHSQHYSYMLSGSFNVIKHKSYINMSSGTWKMAKILLRSTGYLKDSDPVIDADVVKFARPYVKKVILEAIGYLS